MASFEKGFHTATVQEGSNLQFGLGGFDYITDTTALSDYSYVAVQAVGADAVVNLTSEIGDSLTSHTIPEEGWRFGPFSSVQRVSGGNIIAYRYVEA